MDRQGIAPSPCRSNLERDLRGEGFQMGVRSGRWRAFRIEWPFLFVELEVGGESYVTLRLEVEGYPLLAPAGMLWDPTENMPLPPDRWPREGNAERVFRADWSVACQNAPYLACDRTALSNHPDWPISHPERAWNPTRSLDFYLFELHRELTGSRVQSPGTDRA